MKRRVAITIELEVSDLSEEERKAAASDDGCEPDDLPKLDEIEPSFWGEALGAYAANNDPEFYAGSGNYAKVSRLVSATSSYIE
jgi:hypothetical protein